MFRFASIHPQPFPEPFTRPPFRASRLACGIICATERPPRHMDKPPFNPRENDRSQDTLETRAGNAPPEISSPDHNHSGVPSPPTHQSTFAPGDTVAKRFKILRFIAQGGMGEVYEALDIELKQ